MRKYLALFMSSRPYQIAITEGDPAGVGPEIILRLFLEGGFSSQVQPFVVGFVQHFEQAAMALKKKEGLSGLERFAIRAFEAPPEQCPADVIPVIAPRDFSAEDELEPGVISARAGAVAMACIEEAVALISQGKASAVVTAPIHKEALKAAGSPFPGHTEMLAHLAGGADMAMLLAGGGLRVALATIHEPLSKVPELLTEQKILDHILLLHRFLPWFGLKTSKPRIGVTGLNPHAGEGGMFGDEDTAIIAPAVREAQNRGVEVAGPLPADTAFHFHREGAYDGMLAMYHDQALIPVKTLDFHGGVNVTMGLPFIRTSVDHGTAFDIAWKGKARPDSLRSALETALTLVSNRFGDAALCWESD